MIEGCENIAANLANGTYKSVYVPTDEDVEIKEYIRMMALRLN